MTGNSQNEMQCSRFEALLVEALDGALPPELLESFEAHAAGCPVCAPMLAESREGLFWLKSLKEEEPPRNLVHNILAATSQAQAAQATPAARKKNWGALIWKPVQVVLRGAMQPRFVTSFAMAFLSLTLTLTLAGIKIQDIVHADWRPSAIGRAIVLQYTKVENKVVNYYQNMRLVYEIESRVRSLKKSDGTNQNDNQQQQEQPKDKKKNDNDTSGQPDERRERQSRELDNSQIAYLKTNNEGA